jgi:hypothetical protein
MDETSGCGRFPLAFAWPMLLHGGERRWRWEPNRSEEARASSSGARRVPGASDIPPAEAIAAVWASVTARTFDGAGPEALVVPNTLAETQQDALLREVHHRTGRRPELVWRPVAAALAWCVTHGEALVHDGASGSVGRLLTLHCGSAPTAPGREDTGNQTETLRIVAAREHVAVMLCAVTSRIEFVSLPEMMEIYADFVVSHGTLSRPSTPPFPNYFVVFVLVHIL